MTWELTPDLEDSILSALEEGASLVQICLRDGMPSRRTVLRWQRENADFGAKCLHAREAQGDLAADQHNDVVNRTLAGEIAPDVARVVLSGMQWRASKLAPKKYGDKTTLANDPDNPLPASSVTVNVTSDLVKSIVQQVEDEY